MNGVISTLKNTFNKIVEISGINNITDNKLTSQLNTITKFSSKSLLSSVVLISVLSVSSLSANSEINNPLLGKSLSATNNIEIKKENKEVKTQKLVVNVKKQEKENKLSKENIEPKDLSKLELHKLTSRVNNQKILSEEITKDKVDIRLNKQIIEPEEEIDLTKIDLTNLKQGREFAKQFFYNDVSDNAKKWLEQQKGMFDLSNLKIPNTQDKNLPEEHLTSAILYQYLSIGNDSSMFIDKKNINEKISNSVSLLATIAEKECRINDYSLSRFSKTRAFGRFQIVSSTGQEIFIKGLMKNNLDMKKMKSTKFELKELTLEAPKIAKYFDDEHKERTKNMVYNKKLKRDSMEIQKTNTLSIMKRFVYALKENMRKDKQISRYVKEVEKDSGMKTGFLVLQNYIEVMKKAELQGVISLMTFEEKQSLFYEKTSKKERSKMSDNEKIFEILKLYNRDGRIVNYNGVEMMEKEKYVLEAKPIYRRYDNKVVYKNIENNNVNNSIFAFNN